MIVHLFNSSVVSGPETLVLPALREWGEKVCIVFLAESRLSEDAQRSPVEYARKLGHEVHSVPVRSRWDRKAFLELRQLLDRIQPAAVHAHDVKASLYALKASQLKIGKPVETGKFKLISTHHGAAARKGKIRLYEEFYVRMLLPHFDATLCVCESDRLSLLRRGLRAEKLHLHLNGADRDWVAPEERSDAQLKIRERWNQIAVPGLPLPDLKPRLLLGAVARLSSEKRHDRMLRALKVIRNLHPELPISLVCFGIGDQDQALRTLAHELGVEDSVHWMGYSKTIGQEMAGFDLLLCLSDGEGIPVNLIEAGWTGTPVLSTRVGGIPDLIPDPSVGFLVEKTQTDEFIGRKMSELLLNPHLLRETGQRYQERVCSTFSQKAWLDRLEEIYATLT
ncbi:MAG: glycosyltransferase [Methylotenera sp.]|nr:glycosyltransferase [Oligoflexia bacterium]